MVSPCCRAGCGRKAEWLLARFTRPTARCRPSQPRHCRRVVLLGANTLPGLRAKCPKRRVRRRTGARPPRARLPRPRCRPGKGRGSAVQMLRPVSPHRTRHPGHFSGQRKVSVLMRTTWGEPGSASAGWCFPGLNQKASKAGRRSGRFCPASRPMQAEPAAALSPRSAPRSEHAARYEGSVSETPRAAAARDAATPHKAARTPASPRERAALIQMLRPVPRAARRKSATQTKTSPGQGRAHPRNVPRGTF